MSSAREAVETALALIQDVDRLTNAVCTVNTAAVEEADALDRGIAAGRPRGQLHGRGIPVKDNIDTADLLTTAGSLALADRPPASDAVVVRRLREAGLVIVGKSNLSEWANIRDPRSSSGWSAYGGLTRNPYALNRSAGGSSSGSGAAVAAGLVRLAIGTETDGSITCPAAFNGCVGLKPTVGLISTDGVVPVAASQDSVGVMTSTVGEAAELLSVLTGGSVDYASHASDGRLAGKRIGVPRGELWGYSGAADEAAEHALSVLSAEGAVVVDQTNLDSMQGYGYDDELLVMLSELQVGMAAYLATRPGDGPRSLRDIVEFNREHRDQEMPYFGQSFFEAALAGPDLASAEYAAARAACLRHGRDDGIDKALQDHNLDALVTPSWSPATSIDLVNSEHHPGSCSQAAAMAGYPLLTVPSGLRQGLPVAITFWGTARTEPMLIEIGHGYESARDRTDGPLPAPTYPTFV
ncbi:MAG: amidase [Propionibacteriales bacterium]|nr:amidase [Propionibacteriales bacterium]